MFPFWIIFSLQHSPHFENFQVHFNKYISVYQNISGRYTRNGNSDYLVGHGKRMATGMERRHHFYILCIGRIFFTMRTHYLFKKTFKKELSEATQELIYDSQMLTQSENNNHKNNNKCVLNTCHGLGTVLSSFA